MHIDYELPWASSRSANADTHLSVASFLNGRCPDDLLIVFVDKDDATETECFSAGIALEFGGFMDVRADIDDINDIVEDPTDGTDGNVENDDVDCMLSDDVANGDREEKFKPDGDETEDETWAVVVDIAGRDSADVLLGVTSMWWTWTTGVAGGRMDDSRFSFFSGWVGATAISSRCKQCLKDTE